MDDITKMGDWLINIGNHYPDLMCLAVAAITSMAATITVDWYFLCDTTGHPDWIRKQKVGTFLGCWLGATVIAVTWWTLIDPLDQLRFRIIVSFTVEIIPAFIYPFVALYLTKKFPSIASAWAVKL